MKREIKGCEQTTNPRRRTGDSQTASQGRAGLTPAVLDSWSLGETRTLVTEVLGFCAFGAEDA